MSTLLRTPNVPPSSCSQPPPPFRPIENVPMLTVPFDMANVPNVALPAPKETLPCAPGPTRSVPPCIK